ncbi:MAG: HAD-IA family hydrolase [Minisyncoccia bacterium]
MNHPTIKAIVFDVGGVIELSNGKILQKISSLTNIPIEKLQSEYFKHNHLSNIENLGRDEMLLRVVSIFITEDVLLGKVATIINEHFTQKILNTEIIDIFKSLRQHGYKVGILSNDTTKLRDRLTSHGILNYVDTVIISAEIGFQKPQKEAFEILFSSLNLNPNEVVYIDDTQKSLEGSKEIGYFPILFKDNEQLKTDLKNLGIIV